MLVNPSQPITAPGRRAGSTPWRLRLRAWTSCRRPTCRSIRRCSRRSTEPCRTHSPPSTTPEPPMPRRLSRLDAELVRRGLARSRDHAAQLIAGGRVEVHGVIAHKPATGVDADASVRVLDDDSDPGYASRGGHKLAGALAALPQIRVEGRRCLDAGASTGGFTDVLLRAGRGRGRRRRRRVRPAGLVAAHRRPGPGPRPHQRPHADARDDRRPGATDRRRPVVHLAADRPAGADRVHRRRRRPAADGQAAVRGRPRAARLGRSGPRSRGPRRAVVAVAAAARALGWQRARRRAQPAARTVGQRGILPVAAPRRCGDRRRGDHPNRDRTRRAGAAS